MTVPSELYDKRFLLDQLDLPDACLEEHIIDSDRWSIHYQGVFEYQGRFFKVTWSTGATELQDEGPWEYSDPDPVEVVKKEVTCEKWVVV